jgi:hypothetical protein
LIESRIIGRHHRPWPINRFDGNARLPASG